MINDTLYAIYHKDSVQFRQAELFYAQRMSMLYKDLFEEGADRGDVQRVIKGMLERAKVSLEEEEAKNLGGSQSLEGLRAPENLSPR
jgi:hypothetical protein